MSIKTQGGKIIRNLAGDVLTESPVISLDWNYGITKDASNNVSSWGDKIKPIRFTQDDINKNPIVSDDGVYGGLLGGVSFDLSNEWTIYLRFKNDTNLAQKTLFCDQYIGSSVYSYATYGTVIYFTFSDSTVRNYSISTGFSTILGKTKEYILQKRGNKLVIFGNGGNVATDPESDYLYYLQTKTLYSANIRKTLTKGYIGGVGSYANLANANIYNIEFNKHTDSLFDKYVDMVSQSIIRPINTNINE